MKWLEVTVPFNNSNKELLLFNLLELGIQGVIEEERNYKFYLPDSTNLDDLKNKAQKTWGEYSLKEIADENWAENWKQYWHVNKIARFVIVPSWEQYNKKPNEIIIDLDPGMAFGTGTHESTALMLELLADKSPQVVFDIGSGSGILAIAAAKLNALVYAFDIDPLATQATRDNAEKNRVLKNIKVVDGNLLEDDSLFPKEEADLVLTNILAEVIVEFIPLLKKRLSHFTWLLSGIINERVPLVEENLKNNGFTIKKRLDKGEWTALEAII